MGEEPIQAGCRGTNTTLFFLFIYILSFDQGDKLYGRGTTDCLGHVALLTEFFIELAVKMPKLKREVWCVFIARYSISFFVWAQQATCHTLVCSEESSIIPGVGADQLLKDGKLECCKKGPIFWVDAADSNPCIGNCVVLINNVSNPVVSSWPGTGTSLKWNMRIDGHLFHSGLPHKVWVFDMFILCLQHTTCYLQGINSIELAFEAISHIQKKFYAEYVPVSTLADAST